MPGILAASILVLVGTVGMFELLVLPVPALRFVNPTQLVARVRDEAD